ncbi:MAG: TetR/AcrR family transcriptional regulator [Ilumatobacteraceae bacterium]
MTTAVATTDGRRARRERGRLAVTDAMIDLVLDGQTPDVELLTDRAGVSEATLYRYFDNLDELRHATMGRFLVRYGSLFKMPACGEGPLDERIDRFVAARLRLLDRTEPMARFTRMRMAVVPELAAELRQLRTMLASQVRRHFAAELDPLTPARRDDVVAVICTLTSFESWLQLRDDHGRGPTQIRRALISTLRCLLVAP